MALLKCQKGLSVINPQSYVYLSANPSSTFWDDCSCRRAGTVTSSISRGASTESNAQNDVHSAQNSNGNGDKNNNPKSKARLHLSQLGMNVPLKIAEMNKYLSDTSRKIINSGFSLTGSNSNNSSSGKAEDEDSSTYSLEKTVTKMNQSILSYYESTYVNDALYQERASESAAVAMEKAEILDDDFANHPRSPQHEPLFPSYTSAVEAKKRKAQERRAEKISRLSLESRTKALVQALRSAYSLMSRLTRLEELCDHLIAHPECVWEASNDNVLPLLLKLSESPDKSVRGMAFECLSLIGHTKPLEAPGIRILSIDGGGTRGLVVLECLRALEKQTGKKIHKLFDYVCGVSTGALLAAMVCLYKVPLDKCEELYKEYSIKAFTRNRVLGTTRLVWHHGFYDSQIWEEILRKEMGRTPLIEFSRNPEVPKMSAVSCVVAKNGLVNHLFRNYNLPAGVTSSYPGHCKHKIWQVIRASSAAPGYFEPFKLDDEVHEDGGILTNNPTALAIHESRLLWEKENFHCVLSLGTGRFETTTDVPSKLSLKRKISNIVDSACDTEAVHQTLQDLLPSRSYFRFNPYLSEEFMLDEIRPDKMEKMQHDSRMYNRRNKHKMAAVAERLVQKRRPQQLVGDWVKQVVKKL